MSGEVRRPSALKEFLAGTFGGIVQVAVGQPFDTVKVRLQAQSLTAPRYAGFLDCVRQTLRDEGIAGFYKGALTPFIGIGACVSVQFTTLEAMKRYFTARNAGSGTRGTLAGTAPPPPPLSLAQLYVAGAVSGVANSALSGPIEHVRSRLQVQSTGVRLYAGPLDFARKVVAEHGVRALFKGQGVTMVREFHGYGTYFLVYEWLVQREMRQSHRTRSQIPTWKQGVFGAMAGYGLWACIYPIDLIKSRVQLDAFAPHQRAYTGAWDCLRKTVTAYGVTGLYKGFLTVMLRAGPVNAATFVAYELAMDALGR